MPVRLGPQHEAQVPFLHVMHGNDNARRIDERAGFRRHSDMVVRVVSRTGFRRHSDMVVRVVSRTG